MELLTPRFRLRPWQPEDAESLYQLARDPDVGPPAGWYPHTSIENSREIIQTVLSDPETYAILGRRDGLLRGSCGIFPTQASSVTDEPELGYWVGKAFWRRGTARECVQALLVRCFTALGAQRVWCSYFDGNEPSRRCMESCGFRPHHREDHVLWPITGETKTVYYESITLPDWQAETAALEE